MGRLPKKKTEAPEPTPVSPPETLMEGSEAAPKKRRRRRAQSPDYAAETQTLIDAVLRSRGTRGATQEILASVVAWARSVRSEGDALRGLAGQPRRQKTQAPADRTARYEMNKALLEGVLSGNIALDVHDNGDLVFLHTGADVPSPTEHQTGDEGI